MTTKLRNTILTLLLLSLGCGQVLSPSYGRVVIKNPKGQQVFFKREVSGLNHDLLVISPNEGLCDLPNPKTDYVFHEQGPVDVYYKFENDDLILFVGIAASPPENGEFPIRIAQKELDPLDFNSITENPKRFGLQLLSIPIDERLKCGH